MRRVLLVCLMVLGFQARSYGGEDQVWGFDPDLFLKAAAAQLTDAKGYGLVLYQNGKLVGEKYEGIAVSAEDLGGQARPWSQDSVASIGSISKTLTAIGILNVIEDHPEFSLEDPLKKYLPKRWKPNAYFQKITLRQLMTHQAGLPRSFPEGYVSLREVVEHWNPESGQDIHSFRAKPVVDRDCLDARIDQRCYSNLGYALLSPVLANLAFPAAMNQFEIDDQKVDLETYDADFGKMFTVHYEAYLREIFFGKAVPNPEFAATCFGKSNLFFSNHSVWSYYNLLDSQGTEPKDASNCAVGGWMVSPRELVESFHHLFNSEDVLKAKTLATELFEAEDGDTIPFSRSKLVNGEEAYGHNGLIVSMDGLNGSGLKGIDNLLSKENGIKNSIRSQYLHMPQDNVDALLIVNSEIENGLSTVLGLAKKVSSAWLNSPASPYCFFAPPGNPFAFYISRVKLESLDRASGWSPTNYSNFTVQKTVDLQLGKKYLLEVTANSTGNPNLEEAYTVVAWIDYGHDYYFPDSVKVLRSDPEAELKGQQKLVAYFTVPENAVLGKTRLRVQVMDYKEPYITKDYACHHTTGGDEHFTAGEVEDYSVNIVP